MSSPPIEARKRYPCRDHELHLKVIFSGKEAKGLNLFMKFAAENGLISRNKDGLPNISDFARKAIWAFYQQFRESFLKWKEDYNRSKPNV